MDFKIAVLAGDGIGPEISVQGVEVMSAVCEKFGHKVNYEYAICGADAIDKVGDPFPEETYREVWDFIKRYYPNYPLIDHVDTLYGLMLHDKKNERRGANFTLLPGIGEYSLDNYCSKDLVVEALSQV